MSLIDEINSALPPSVFQLCSTLKEKGHRAWLVGGAVRELLRKNASVKVADFDFATTATPSAMINIFAKVIPTGIDHGTVTVLLQGQSFEVTTLRGEEGYSDGRHPDRVYFTEDLREDLARRDFTINAIAYDPLTGVIEDPFFGQRDLTRSLIKAVGDAPSRFAEDGLRIMRCARFAAKLQFNVEEKTRQALAPAIPSYQKVAKERIIDEWWKALKTPRPSLCFELLHQEKILRATSSCFVDSQVPKKTWREFDQLSPADPCIRLAFLLLQLFQGSREPKILGPFLKAMKLSQKQSQSVTGALQATSSIWLLAHSQSPNKVSAFELRAWIAQVGRLEANNCQSLFRAYGRCQLENPEKLADFLLLCERAKAETQISCAYNRKELALTGAELMQLGVNKGPDIGRWLDAMMRATWEDPALNQADRLKGWLRPQLLL